MEKLTVTVEIDLLIYALRKFLGDPSRLDGRVVRDTREVDNLNITLNTPRVSEV